MSNQWLNEIIVYMLFIINKLICYLLINGEYLLVKKFKLSLKLI